MFTRRGEPGDFERLLLGPKLWHPRDGARFVLEELLNHLHEAFAVTAAFSQARDTVLVSSSLSWGMRLLQDCTDLPAAVVHLWLMVLRSVWLPPILPGVGDLS